MGMNPYPVGMNPYPLGMEPYPLGMDPYLLGMDPYLFSMDPYRISTYGSILFGNGYSVVYIKLHLFQVHVTGRLLRNI